MGLYELIAKFSEDMGARRSSCFDNDNNSKGDSEMSKNELSKHFGSNFLSTMNDKSYIMDIERSLSPGSIFERDDDFYVSYIERHFPNGVIEKEKRYGYHRHISIRKGY